MKAIIIYDSLYGNTGEIARSIGNAVGNETRVVKVNEANPAELSAFDFFFVGAPTQGGRPTKAMQAFLDSVPESVLKGKKTAVFDTRLSTKLVGIFGYAAGRMSDTLRKKGALVLGVEGFFVTGKESSLKDGELARAANWAAEIVKK